ncbi:MAG: hypothetical protein IJW20_07375 [Clostridia bacterium]|nr:hypothetical protein [Clostridia bacterium]
MNNKALENKDIININKYNNLLKKLSERGLVTPNGFQLRSREYCEYHELGVLDFSDQIIYSGTLIQEVRDLSDYEIVMLMEREDVIAYDVTKRKDNGYFLIKVFKLSEKR